MKKKFCSFWWLSQIISVALAFSDPHAGVIALVLLIPMFVMLIGMAVSSPGKRKKVEADDDDFKAKLNNFSVELIRIRNAISTVIVPVCILIFTVTCSTIMFMLRTAFSGMIGDEPMLIFPWNMWHSPLSDNTEIIFSSIAIALQIVALVQYLVFWISRRRRNQESE